MGLELPHKGFRYEACLFGHVAQHETAQKGVVNGLGTFRGWFRPEPYNSVEPTPTVGAPHQVMAFGGGDECAGVGERRTLLHLHCGEAERLVAAEEPSPCVYHLKATTPVVCDLQIFRSAYEQMVAEAAALGVAFEADERLRDLLTHEKLPGARE